MLEEWFRWGDEWSLLLRGYGRLARDHAVLEIRCGLGRIAFPLRYVLSSTGSYEGFEIQRQKVAFLQEHFEPCYPNFRFRWVDLHNTFYNPDGQTSPATYEFPYADASFDVVYAASIFTHMLPDTVAHYFREAACVEAWWPLRLQFFLLDYYLAGYPRPLGFADPIFNFSHTYGDYGDEFAIVVPENPEQMTALRTSLVRRFADEAGLAMVNEPLAGLWSGRVDNWVSTQDVVVLTKRRQ